MGWLVLCSLFFYSWWNLVYLPLMLASILFNYLVGSSLGRGKLKAPGRKALLWAGVSVNVGLLAYYKYSDFFITTANALSGSRIGLLNLVLPLAISFFTFTQITYLVDSYNGEAREYDLLSYSLFVTFFPHLIAGPIIHHKEMMPQFHAVRNKVVNYKNISTGLYIFSIGLFKKVAVADTLAALATHGFDEAHTLSFTGGWVTALSYTFQIYFDFSGYTDMSIGSALLFNIVLPINFNSPYKATSIKDFWHRWHMTLSRFLRDYVYIPLGGNRGGEINMYRNLMITFFIGGLWHGANWTFVVWGILHGLALVVGRLWEKTGIKVHRAAGWFMTFSFVCVTWVVFRAKEWKDAVKVLRAMFGFNGFGLSGFWDYKPPLFSIFNTVFHGWMITPGRVLAFYYLVIFAVLIIAKNSNQMFREFKPDWRTLAFGGTVAAYSLLTMNRISEFLYFNF